MSAVEVRAVDLAGPPPPYCCAILHDPGGRLVLERRPAHKTDAPGQLTCFGGRREAGELPLACIARELREELGFVPSALPDRPALALHVGGELIAWFWAAPLDEGPEMRPEPGVTVVRRAPEELAFPDVSGWHLPVLRAWLRAASRSADPGPERA